MAQVPGPLAPQIDRDRFVLDRRGPRPAHDPWRPQSAFLERERAADGRVVPVATILLTGRECPWRCVMCDLWQHTIEDDTPVGALPRQFDLAMDAVDADAHPEHVKLYNSGSFFDSRAVPEADHEPLARRLARFRHVVVECHPALAGERVFRFRDRLAQMSGASGPTLEVAMGLETAHPEALRQLHKGFTVEQFAAAAERLTRGGVAIRVFLLVGVPWIDAGFQRAWVARSIETAFDCGASVVSLIPTRPGNGAIDALAEAGHFAAPTLADLETALSDGLRAPRGRVFADTWDLERVSRCPACLDARRRRLQRMNEEQRVLPPVTCARCAGVTAYA